MNRGDALALVDTPVDEVCAAARALRTTRVVTYSPKVFIPLTKLCRDVCHYCTFARPPRRGQPAYLTEDEVLAIAHAGAAAGCHEALFTLGDKPERRYRVARDELAAARLATIAAAGRAGVPFTTGILIGIGETRAERIEALLAIRDLHERHGHVQEVIVQNFRAKPGTRMAGAPEPSLDELLWSAAAARVVLPPDVQVQAPPNLSYGDFPRLLEAGIDDWGGVSPVTIDHVNPEAPWPEIERLGAATRAAGLELAPRLAVYPEYLGGEWIDPTVLPAALRRADGNGLAREDRWSAGASAPIPFVPRDALPVDTGEELGEDEIVRLFSARGEEADRVFAAADGLRREVCGDEVTYVVTRNVNYTNVCYFRCGFCAFSKGKLAEDLRGNPRARAGHVPRAPA